MGLKKAVCKACWAEVVYQRQQAEEAAAKKLEERRVKEEQLQQAKVTQNPQPSKWEAVLKQGLAGSLKDALSADGWAAINSCSIRNNIPDNVPDVDLCFKQGVIYCPYHLDPARNDEAVLRGHAHTNMPPPPCCPFKYRVLHLENDNDPEY